MDIKYIPADKSNYGGVRDLKQIKYIVVHYTGNDGDSAEGNCKYFSVANRGASAHYFVDSKGVCQSVLDNYVAWHCGGNKYPNCSTTGGGSMYGIVTNYNSIGIEICDDRRNCRIEPSEDTLKNVIELVKGLMKKYNIPISNIVRHFDVTGKACPAYWASRENEGWDKFKRSLIESNINKESVNKQVNKNEYKVKVRVNALNIREQPSINSGVNGVIRDKGVYTIVETQGDWGKLKSGAGWVNLKYTDKI